MRFGTQDIKRREQRDCSAPSLLISLRKNDYLSLKKQSNERNEQVVIGDIYVGDSLYKL